MLTKINNHQISQSAIDATMMAQCIKLSSVAVQRGEFPFSAIVCEGAEVIAEATNQVAQSGDVTRHAELIAISEAQKLLGRKDLARCSIYSNVEPCVMCSFPIRETRIGRVVFAINSPIMGGYSKWNVLRDAELSRTMPEAFGSVPEVVSGLLRREAEKVWRDWNPLIWAVIKRRGCFGTQVTSDDCLHLAAAPERIGLVRRLLMRNHNHDSA